MTLKAIDNPEIKQWVMDCGIMASRIGRERLLDIIDAHTNAAVLAERDACAKECDYVANMQCNGASAAYLDGHQIAAQVITQRIRARGEV